MAPCWQLQLGMTLFRLLFFGGQPEDISHGSSRIWVMDETSIPRSHQEMERLVIMQGGLSKMYNQYWLPNRKRVWAGGNDEKFMRDNSLYTAKLSTSKLYFLMLKIVKETVSKNLLSTGAKAKR
uniref:Uncharacterized protein n=1 Tax=Aegilops tauschii TaxID=37682 RepID=M8AVK5_AEGTA